MCERDADVPGLPWSLAMIIDEELARLRGAICAAYAASDGLFSEAKEAAALAPKHIGLKWALEVAEETVAELSDKLDTAHRMALEQAGGVLPAEADA